MRPWKLTEGLAPAAIPAGAYACALSFKAGYFGQLGIPRQFIAIGTNNLVAVSMATLMVALVALFLLDIISLVFGASASLLAKAIARMIPALLLLSFGALFADYFPFSLLALLAAGVGALVIGEFIVPLLVHRRESGYQAKLAAWERLMSGRTSLLGRKLGFVGYTSVVIIAYSILFLYSFYELGIGRAAKQREFLVLAGPPERVILAMNGEMLGAVKADLAYSASRRQTSHYGHEGHRSSTKGWGQLIV